MAKRWDEGTETLRGIAILLMTAGHVIGHDSSAGMQVADDSAWRHLYVSLQFLRMPLFTVISGYVYAIRPVEAGATAAFLRRKLRRLLLPMVVVGSVFFLLRMVLPTNDPGKLTDIWRIYLFPYAHFWYLQALLLVFLVAVVLERLGALGSITGWVASCAGAAALLFFFPFFVSFFSFQRSLYLLPFFLFGVGLCRFPVLLRDGRVAVVALSILVGGLVWQQLAWFGFIADRPPPTSPIGVAVGLAASLLLFRFRTGVGPLVSLGGFAYGIYLLHILGTAGSRIALRKLGIHHPVLVFGAGLVAGSVVPILIELAARRSYWATMLIFGQRKRRRA